MSFLARTHQPEEGRNPVTTLFTIRTGGKTIATLTPQADDAVQVSIDRNGSALAGLDFRADGTVHVGHWPDGEVWETAAVMTGSPNGYTAEDAARGQGYAAAIDVMRAENLPMSVGLLEAARDLEHLDAVDSSPLDMTDLGTDELHPRLVDAVKGLPAGHPVRALWDRLDEILTDGGPECLPAAWDAAPEWGV
jgi:hypothetical protein